MANQEPNGRHFSTDSRPNSAAPRHARTRLSKPYIVILSLVVTVFVLAGTGIVVWSRAMKVPAKTTVQTVTTTASQPSATLTTVTTTTTAETTTTTTTLDAAFLKKQQEKIDAAVKSPAAQVTGNVLSGSAYKYEASEDAVSSKKQQADKKKEDTDTDDKNTIVNIAVPPATTTTSSAPTTTTEETTTTKAPTTTTVTTTASPSSSASGGAETTTTTTKAVTTTTTTTKVTTTTTTAVKYTDGWNTVSGNTYFYSQKAPLKGWADIGGYRYHFDEQSGALNSQVGIDVSTYQGTINWTKVKNAGVKFAFIRVGFRGYGSSGKLCIDPRFETNLTEARKAGIACGVYFYSVAKDEVEGVQEANFVINALKGYTLDLPVVIDVEHRGNRVEGVSAAQRTNNTLAFLKTMKDTGRSVMIYTGYDFYYHLLQPSRLTAYPLWIAFYTGDPQKVTKAPYKYWQYSDSGSVSGISGNVDLDVYFPTHA